MKVYFHHVGQLGASEDFKKTVFARIPITLVETAVPNSDASKTELLTSLHKNFPIGSFNCWGVPDGAASVIQNLSVGDVVLLVASASTSGGNIPAFGVVRTFLRNEYHGLSHSLWGKEHYPYIFFFETERLQMEWTDLIGDFGYQPNFDPRGKFYSVADERINGVGGAAKYLLYLRTKRKTKYEPKKTPIDYLKSVLREQPPEYQTQAQNELKKILSDSERQNPQLTDENQPRVVVTQIAPRDAAFRNEVRRVYGERCAVCGTNRYSRDGYPEVEGAHIYPKRLKGRDLVQNGISLCKLHHWAFDAGWFSLQDDLTIIVHPDIPKVEAYGFVSRYQGKSIAVPENRALSPHPVFLREHRKMHGFE